MDPRFDYKLIVFDLDGTLIDSKQDIVTTTNAMLKQMGFSTLADERIQAFVGWGMRDLIEKTLLESLKGVPNEKDVEKALHIFSEKYEKHCLDQTTWYSGVEETLRELSRHYQLAILTNKPRQFTSLILGALPGGDLFNYVICGDDEFPKKPSPESAYWVMKKIGCASYQALMVGDSRVDLDTAHNAGMDLALVTYGFGPLSPSVLQEAQFMVNHFQELLHHL